MTPILTQRQINCDIAAIRKLRKALEPLRTGLFSTETWFLFPPDLDEYLARREDQLTKMLDGEMP